MAYQTYITEALVCGSRAHNTSDRSYLLFTREAGMLYAQAKSVREERSKQRFALQEFSYIRTTLIHGKSGWRVAGVEAIENLYMKEPAREARGFLRGIVLLLRRLIQGETPHPELFDEVLEVLIKHRHRTSGIGEQVLTVRILGMLGYLSPNAFVAALLPPTPFIMAMNEYKIEDATLIGEAIKDALRHSHL